VDERHARQADLRGPPPAQPARRPRFYDLRVPETRQAQADLARQYGVGAFCYYHYWFAGRRVLERPFNEVLASGEPDFPFCLCWANDSWSGVWYGAPQKVLIRQTYPGEDDHRRHFDALLPAFHDPRYLRVDDRPVFAVFKPHDIPEVGRFTALWQQLAVQHGLPGIHFVGFTWNWQWDHRAEGFDACLPQHDMQVAPPAKKPDARVPTVYRYETALRRCMPEGENGRHFYPCVLPNWDNTPRSGANGLVLLDATPDLFRLQVRHALKLVKDRPGQQLVFVKAWNEWAEGNYLEPDQRFGHGWLQAVRDELGG
jgi:hypothetical protein